MSTVRLVTDSTADLREDVRKEWNIEMVPLKVHVNKETFLDGVTLQTDEMFQMLGEKDPIPTTSQPSPVDFVNIYKKIAGEDPQCEIISVHLSSSFSGTYQSACMAKDMLEGTVKVTVIDSKSASYGLGLLAVAGAKAAGEGKSKDECIKRILQLMDEAKVFFLVDSFEYLLKGGRIGKAASVIGTLLHVKPILSLNEAGEIVPVEKIRGQKKAIARIAESLLQQFGERTVHAAAIHSLNEPLARAIYEAAASRLQIKQVEFITLSPAIASHVGPGVAGIFIYPE